MGDRFVLGRWTSDELGEEALQALELGSWPPECGQQGPRLPVGASPWSLGASRYGRGVVGPLRAQSSPRCCCHQPALLTVAEGWTGSLCPHHSLSEAHP